jgi:tetratricopeptide (TPR) repeat protein
MRSSPLVSIGPAAGIVIVLCFTAAVQVGAEIGYVMVQITDLHHRPIAKIEIEIEGYGGVSVSGTDGKARIPIGRSAEPGDPITLALVSQPTADRLVILSPWDGRATVPRFEDKPENYIPVELVPQGKKELLENEAFNRGAATNVSFVRQRYVSDQQSPAASLVYSSSDLNVQGSPASTKTEIARNIGTDSAVKSQVPLDQVAEKYGFSPQSLDHAIRAWGAKSNSAYDVGIFSYYRADFETAAQKLEQAFSGAQKEPARTPGQAFQKERLMTNSAYFLGSSLSELGKYTRATNAYLEYLSFVPNNVYVLDNVARNFQEEQNYAAAKKYSDKAETVARRTYKPDDPRLASVLDTSGLTALVGGDAGRAEKLFMEAIDIDKRGLPGAGHNLAATYNNLGIALEIQRRYAEAESAFQDAIAMDDRLLGKDNLQSARYRNNLGMLWDTTHQYERAAKEFRSLLDLRLRLQMHNHPDVAKTLANLAHALVGLNQYSEAQKYSIQALDLDRAIFGTVSVQVAEDLYSLAQVQIFLKDYVSAERNLYEALKINKLLSGGDSLNYARTLNLLADASWRLGKFETAESQSAKALPILDKTLPSDSPFLAVCWEQSGIILASNHRMNEAVTALEKALNIANESLGPRHHTTVRIRAELERARKGQLPLE